MTLARSVAEILDQHSRLCLSSIDRLYLNLYVPMLQTEQGTAWFWRQHRGHDFASSALMAPMSRVFVERIEAFAQREGIELVTFSKHERKEDVAQEFLADFRADEGVLFIGKAQEKASVIRTERRRNPHTGGSYAWLVKSTAMVNQYYFYCVDRDFGRFFLKFCSYFPYNGKLCLNGHEYLKRQAARAGLRFSADDNCILSCTDPQRLQLLADQLTPEKIDALARKWFRRLPHPFPPKDRAAGFRYDISILQAEFATTHMFERPQTGRLLFEQLIRDNLDLGRPEQVQLIFDRRILRTTPARFRTRVITNGVIPSLHVDFKTNRIKQYHKLGQEQVETSSITRGGLRTEITINNTLDFGIGKRLVNLPALRKVGFQTNQRLLDVQRISHDCTIGEDAFHDIQRPAQVENQRAASLRFGDPRVLALFGAIILFRLLPRGFRNRDLRDHVAPLLGLPSERITQGKMTYDLRRLRLHGFIQRVPRSQRYRVTDFGFRAALFLLRSQARLLRPGLSVLGSRDPPSSAPLRNAVLSVEQAIDRLFAA
jgi:hypothetical protein